jgi:hypothetical protein
MKISSLLLVGGVALGAFWLLSRSSNAQGSTTTHTGTSYGATIYNTKGEQIILREQNGLIVDQYGGIWT